MRKRDPQSLTNDQFIASFMEVSMACSDAIDYNDHSRFNRLVDEYLAIESDFKVAPRRSATGAQAALGSHQSTSSIDAAYATLAVLPEEAKQALQLMRQRRENPQAGDALGMLNAIEAGSYVPQ